MRGFFDSDLFDMLARKNVQFIVIMGCGEEVVVVAVVVVSKEEIVESEYVHYHSSCSNSKLTTSTRIDELMQS